ncbi:UNKNOWN [Stylonychia lemnae]|uniref:Uncharacterized protein n=1 Tax=Stylonychia lemnae TaxID=5949 RepID=A0A078B600_STYLE|nr:UNKNOWN [Stylonychia lemnae]|eukprot:CDW88918.1 UNKNOWN [Stylonychia lemnae]
MMYIFLLQTLVHISVSVRIYRKKEEPQNKVKVLKFWIEVYDAVLALIYLILLVENFRFSEYVYDNLIEDLIHSQESRIDRWVKGASEYIEANTKDWMIGTKDFILKTLNNALVPMVMDLVRNAIYGQQNLNLAQHDKEQKEGEQKPEEEKKSEEELKKSVHDID